MPRMITVLVTWLRENALFKSNLLKKVADAIEANLASFPGSPFSHDDLVKFVNDLNNKYAVHENGPLAKTQYEQALKVVDDALHDMKVFVDGIAKGRKEIIELAGFTASDPTSHPATIPEAPTTTVQAEGAGRLKVNCSHVSNADSYLKVISLNHQLDLRVMGNHIIIPHPDGDIYIVTTGKEHDTVEGLPIDAKAYVTSLAQNAAGKSAFSPVVKKTVVDT